MPPLWVGIAFLALATLTTSTFMWIMRYSQERGYSVLAVGGVNYVTAAAVALPLTSLHDLRRTTLHLWLLAGASGIGFVLTYLLLIPALRQHGVATPTAAVQISMVVPVFLAPLLWQERLGPFQALGVAISALAIVLLMPPARARAASLPHPSWLLVPGIFALSGATRVAQKALAVLVPGAGQLALAFIWFGAAAVFAFALLARTGWPRRRGEWLAGLCLGVVNLGSLVFLLRALSALPATLVFPAVSCLSLTLTTVGAYLLWRERPTPRASLGMAVGVLALLLVGSH